MPNQQLKLIPDATAPTAPLPPPDQSTLLPYLGGTLTLKTGTYVKHSQRSDNDLHLPLPAEAAADDIRHHANAWLRSEAKRILGQLVQQKSALAARPAPRLSFATTTRGRWIEVAGPHALRCNLHLIEQPLTVIEQAVSQAIAGLPPDEKPSDLFAALLT